MPVQAILFDADGVIQRNAVPWREQFTWLLGRDGEDVDRFMKAVFDAERPALVGKADFGAILAELLEQWDCPRARDEALSIWHQVEVHAEILAVVRRLRHSAVRCYLATNQQSHRARYMSQSLGYDSLFDGEFYSCHLGARKPSGAFFHAIVDAVGLLPTELLFLDDSELNVAGAREGGLQATLFRGADGPAALHDVLRAFEIDVPPEP